MKHSTSWAAARIAALYLIFAGAWILFSDRLLAGLIADPDTLTQLQTYKGWLFVLVTTALLYFARRQSDEALRQSQFFLEKAQHVAHIGHWISDPGPSGALSWSKETYRIFGLDERTFDGKRETFFALVHPDDREAVQAASRAALAGERPYSLDHRILRSDGRICWVHEQAEVLRDAAGHPIQMIGIVQDITERRRLEQESRRLSRAIEQSPTTVVITDTHGNIEYVNPSFTRTTGYTREEAVGQNPRILKSGHTSPDEYKRMWHIITSGGEWRGEFHNRRKNGELYWENAVLSPVTNEAGEITHFLAVKEDVTERKQAEEARRLSEAQLQAAVENLPFDFWACDPQGRYILQNARSIQRWGNLVGKTALEAAVDEDTRAEWQDNRQRAFAGEVVRVERTVRDGDKLRHTYKTVAPIRDGNEIRGVIGITQDITELKRAEEALRASEEHFRLLVEGARDYAIFMLDPDGRVASWNAAAERIQGYEADEIVGQHVSRFYAPEDVQAGASDLLLKTTVEGHVQIEGWRVRKDGTRFWAEVAMTALRNEDGELRGFAKMTRDLTERRQAAQAVQESQARLNGIITSAMDAIITINHDQRIVLFNAAAEAMFGYPAATLIGQPIDRLIPQRFRDIHRQHIRAFEQTGVTNRHMGALGAISGVRANSEEFPIEASISQIEVGGHKFFTVILRDITERKRAEAALERLNAELEQRVVERTAELQTKNRELETFTYSVSHDLKAPLRGIDGYSRILLEDYTERLDDEGRRFLSTIRGATSQMNQLIDDLLSYSRLERRSLAPSRLEPRRLVEALLVERADDLRARGVEVSVDIPCQAVSADSEGLAQALRNLIDNALKFTRDVAAPRVEIGGRETESGCMLWVRDNGVGFDMRYHDRIFDIFQRLHRVEDYAGTGIGLAIVRKAMQRMGGRAWAESQPGHGAIFYLELPR
jgi:PAS domain S-box-containing protein